METYSKPIILILISFVILAVFYHIYSKKINTDENKEISASIRKRYSYIRFCIVILAVTFIFLLLSYNNPFYIFGFLIFSIKWINLFMRKILPVSSKQLKDISQEEKFVLYLRGFSSDNYTGISTLVENSQFDGFSEYHFINILNKYFPVYTVGMTKELSSPYGAKRIYLDDNVWEEDVSKLINIAEIVIVLVNDSDNCIKEIERCYNLNKTILVVDDENKLTKVNRYFESKKHLYPFPTSIKSQTLLYDYNPFNSYSALAYENSEKSYRRIIKQLMKERYGVSRLVLPHMLTDPTTVYFFILLSLTLLLMIKPQSTNIEVIIYFLFITIIFVIIIKMYSLPMSKWRKIKKNKTKNTTHL